MKRARPDAFDGFIAQHARDIVSSIATAWDVPREIVAVIVSMPAAGPVGRETLDRLTHLMNLSQELMRLFTDAVARGWPNVPNPFRPFRGCTPLELMAEGGLEAIVACRRHLSLLRDQF